MSFPTSPVNGQTTSTNGIVYTYNSTNSAWKRTPGVSNFSLGVGQTWTRYTIASGLRTNNTVYTNSTGRSIFVSIMARGDAGVSQILLDGVLFSSEGGDNNNVSPLSCIVPNGSTYQLTGLGRSGDAWWELR